MVQYGIIQGTALLLPYLQWVGYRVITIVLCDLMLTDLSSRDTYKKTISCRLGPRPLRNAVLTWKLEVPPSSAT